MGSDLSVVNAARVSFGRKSHEKGYDEIVIDGHYKNQIDQISNILEEKSIWQRKCF